MARDPLESEEMDEEVPGGDDDAPPWEDNLDYDELDDEDEDDPVDPDECCGCPCSPGCDENGDCCGCHAKP